MSPGLRVVETQAFNFLSSAIKRLHCTQCRGNGVQDHGGKYQNIVPANYSPFFATFLFPDTNLHNIADAFLLGM